MVLVITGTAIDQDNKTHQRDAKPSTGKLFDKKNLTSTSSNSHETALGRAPWNVTFNSDLQMLNSSNLSPHVINSSNLVKGPLLRSPVLPFRHRKTHETPAFSRLKPCETNNHLSMEANLSVMSSSRRELYLEEEGLDIRWSELVIKKKIGEGMCYWLKDKELHAVLIINASILFLSKMYKYC